MPHGCQHAGSWGKTVVCDPDSADLANFEFVRLKPADESAITDLAEASTKARVEADVLEREIAQDAGKVIENFTARRK